LTVDMHEHSRSPARDRILGAAGELFYEHGFQAIGVDLIVERSGVAKTTLYQHFPSKNDLIACYLDTANIQFWAWFDGSLPTGASAADQLIGLFEAVERVATDRTCRGCTFQIAAGEFPDADHAGHRVALAHKRTVRARLTALARAVPADDPAALADGLMMLMDGAFAAARMYGPRSPARHVAAAARALIDAAGRPIGLTSEGPPALGQ
jgi:AcrR family transcriptional regulator